MGRLVGETTASPNQEISRYRKTAAFLLLCLGALGLVIWLAHVLVGEQLEGMAQKTIAAGGLTVFFLIITAINILIVPMSADVLIAISPSILDVDILWIALASGISPMLAAWADLLLGRKYGAMALIRIIGVDSYQTTRSVVDRYGIAAIAITAITPIPFSAVCWTCGIARFPVSRALITVLLTRVPRHLLVLVFADWIIGLFG